MEEQRQSRSEPAGGESWSRLQELAADLRERLDNHRIGAESARVAYYVFLSLFPFLLAIFALTGYLGREALFSWIMHELLAALPPQAALALEDSVRQITHVRRPGTLAMALLVTSWGASNALTALADGLNAAFRVDRRRRWWQKKVLGVVVVAIACAAVLLGALAVLAGPEIGAQIGLRQLGSLLRWPVAAGLVVGMTWLCYYLLPNRKQGAVKLHLLGGAAVAAAMWAICTLVFRLYLSSFGRLDVVYGVLGGVVALLVWLYLAAMSILFGGEVAAGLERFSRRRRAQPESERPSSAEPCRRSASGGL
jgi:membrane protein